MKIYRNKSAEERHQLSTLVSHMMRLGRSVGFRHYMELVFAWILLQVLCDYELMSKYCHLCKNKASEGCTNEQWKQWMEHHEAASNINHEGSSKAMEQEAAKVIWNRSEELHNLRYVDMLSDGDSSSFAAIVELLPYGPYV